MPKKFHPFAMFMAIMSIYCSPLHAQDPFFTHFFNAESYFNPALVGYRGATSVGVKYKSQWYSSDAPAYESIYASYEESLPCSLLDYGLNISKDVEGSGLLQTTQLGGQIAGAIPFGSNRILGNLRLGGGLQWGQKRIDYNRLIFSDQLDPKYGFSDVNGIEFTSNFTAPNGGESLWYFAPSVGFSLRLLFLKKRNKTQSPTLHFGGAIHNAYAIGKGPYRGNEDSVLGSGTFLPKRITAFASFEIVPYSDKQNYLSLKPILFYQRQSSIDAFTIGTRLGFNRVVAVGIYAQLNEKQAEGANSNWLTFTLELGKVMKKYSRADFGIAYSSNFSGLRNSLGPILEFSAVFHFGKSAVCGWMNQDNDLTRKGVSCPSSNLTPGRNKMYENIWYKNN